MKNNRQNSTTLTFADRLHYGLGTIGYNASVYWFSAFLQIYYTDTIGVSASALSILVLAVRLFDAINDPIIGSLADRTKTGWGRYRPWLLFAGIGLPICMICLFGAKAAWSPTVKVVWMCVWYVMATVMSTCYDMPYSALHGAMSPKSADRVKISSIRMLCAQIGTQITGIFGIQLVLYFSHAAGARTEGGYLTAVALICLATMPLSLWTAFKGRERVQPPPTQKKIPLRGQMMTLIKNPPILIISFAMLTFGFIGYGRGSMMMYYFTYVLGNPRMMSLFGTLSMLGTIAGSMVVMPLLYGLLRNKGTTAAVGHLLCGLSCLAVYFVVPGGVLFWTLMFVTPMFMSTFSSAQYSMLGDAVDYGEWKFGLRCDGFLSSFTSLALKTGGAIAPALGLALISAAKYVPNAVQTPQVISAMKCTISVIPGVTALISATLIFLFYRLDEKKHETIRMELEARRTAGIPAVPEAEI